jgi:membrane associated rhomboid family serine protease
VTDPFGGLAEDLPPEPAPQRMPAPPRPTTWALLIVFGAAFAAEALVGRDPMVENSLALFRLGALYAPAVRDGDIWRIGSYAFLHIGWLHLLVNSYVLWSIAPQLEMTFGSNVTLGLFAATAIAGGAASTALSLQMGTEHLAAGASGGIFGLLGATVALYLRVRKNLPEPVRRGFVRAMVINLLINLAIAFKAPVDNAAHVGGLVSGILLGLVAPLSRGERRAWHGVARFGLVASALALAAMEGAAVARAVKPRPRTLRGQTVVAQVPWLLVPAKPGVAYLPGIVEAHIRREDRPLSIPAGADAVRLGDRTWVRQRSSEDGMEDAVYQASDGGGTLVIEFACRDPICKGARGEDMVAFIAGSVRPLL